MSFENTLITGNTFISVLNSGSTSYIQPNTIIHGYCLEVMKNIPDKSIDMVLCDLPYEVTSCEWDVIIPFDKLWEQYNRIVKPNGAILLFGTEPFSSHLRMSNLKDYRYDWIWNKLSTSNFANVSKMPLNCYEIISVFYKQLPTYNPQMTDADPKKVRPIDKTYTNKSKTNHQHSGITKKYSEGYDIKKRYPIKIINISSREKECNSHNKQHETQKPVSLGEYLIKTYSNEGDVILDNTMGVGSFGVSATNLNRKFIGIEKEEKYFDVCKIRLSGFTVIS